MSCARHIIGFAIGFPLAVAAIMGLTSGGVAVCVWTAKALGASEDVGLFAFCVLFSAALGALIGLIVCRGAR